MPTPTPKSRSPCKCARLRLLLSYAHCRLTECCYHPLESGERTRRYNYRQMESIRAKVGLMDLDLLGHKRLENLLLLPLLQVVNLTRLDWQYETGRICSSELIEVELMWNEEWLSRYVVKLCFILLRSRMYSANLFTNRLFVILYRFVFVKKLGGGGGGSDYPEHICLALCINIVLLFCLEVSIVSGELN